jgi:hypothetical protein
MIKQQQQHQGAAAANRGLQLPAIVLKLSCDAAARCRHASRKADRMNH